MDKIKKCIWCGRQNKKQNRTISVGALLRYIEDPSGTYTCNECEDHIRNWFKDEDYYLHSWRKYGPSKADLDDAAEFEKTLDLDFTEEDIMNIVEQENKDKEITE